MRFANIEERRLLTRQFAINGCRHDRFIRPSSWLARTMCFVFFDVVCRDRVQGFAFEFEKSQQWLTRCLVSTIGGGMLSMFCFGPLEKTVHRLSENGHWHLLTFDDADATFCQSCPVRRGFLQP